MTFIIFNADLPYFDFTGLLLVWFPANFDLPLLFVCEGFPVIMVSTSLSIAVGKGGIQSYTSDK